MTHTEVTRLRAAAATADRIPKRWLHLPLPLLMCDGTLTLLHQHVGLSLHPLNLGIPGPLWPAARAKGNCAPGHSPVSLADHFLSWKQQLPKKRDTTCWGGQTILPRGSWGGRGVA